MNSDPVDQCPTADDIRAKVAAVAFGNPLVVNSLRGLVAEIIIGAALGTEWRWCSGDWRGWDFEHTSGCRLEVKQSAARQTWAAPKKRGSPVFDIRARTGYYEGADWVAMPARHAQIYVFAYHPVIDDSANHCDPFQWFFHVVPASRLPMGKTIRLARVTTLANVVSWGELRAAVEHIRAL